MCHCNNRIVLLLVLLGVAFAYGSPVSFYNTGFGNADPTGVGCSSFTKKFDPYTGYFTYRCRPDVTTSNYLSTHSLVKTSPDTAADIDDKESAEDDILAPQESFSGRSGGPYVKDTYQSFTSGRSGGSRKNNRQKKRPTSSRRNRCPPGQMFQSELNICIDFPSAPPLPPKRPSNHRLNPYDLVLGNRPNKRPTSSYRNRCPVGQMFQSELNICIDYSSSPPLPPKRPSNHRLSPYDLMLGDARAPVRPVSAARQRRPASGTILSVGKFDIKNRCKPSELYISELDICLPKNNCYPYGRTC